MDDKTSSKNVSEKDISYQSAISHLNSLLSVAETIYKSVNVRDYLKNIPNESLKFLKLLDIKTEQLDSLNVIHVTGTKGKGSTCAMTDSILHHLGFKTGFFSSPHLIHVRERIRINSTPISEEKFAKYFFEVYNALLASVGSVASMPPFFKFMALLAFYVFLKEKVDVAIIEVGIGGEYDSTNVFLNPIVCGITLLDIDHVSVLGNTLPEIAWHKAGIMKKGSIAVGCEQASDAMKVIKKIAAERECQFYQVPKIDEHKILMNSILPGEHQLTNLSIALQLVRIWLNKTNNIDAWPSIKLSLPFNGDILPGFSVPQEFLDGLKKCSWKGRGQILKKGNITYFIDGAHTPKSIECCNKWYSKTHLSSKSNVFQILLFFCTADRKPSILLSQLKNIEFDTVIFSCATIYPDADKDFGNSVIFEDEQMKKCQECYESWKEIFGKENSKICNYVSDAIDEINNISNTKKEVHVLVTGSLRLVGSVLALLDPVG
jgi:folylpolyglutamate synthase